MTQQNKTVYQSTVDSLAADNTTGDISELDVRTLYKNLSDSVKHIDFTLDALGTNPTTWDIGSYHSLQATITLTGTNTLTLSNTQNSGEYYLYVNKGDASDTTLTIAQTGLNVIHDGYAQSAGGSLVLRGASGDDFLVKITRVSGVLFVNNLSIRVIDEDNMASDTANAVPTQQSVKAYVDSNPTSALQNIVEDTTPQLGGELQTNGFDINFGNTDAIQVDGVDNITFDGSNNTTIANLLAVNTTLGAGGHDIQLPINGQIGQSTASNSFVSFNSTLTRMRNGTEVNLYAAGGAGEITFNVSSNEIFRVDTDSLDLNPTAYSGSSGTQLYGDINLDISGQTSTAAFNGIDLDITVGARSASGQANAIVLKKDSTQVLNIDVDGGIYFGSTGDTGIYEGAANVIYFYANGGDRATLDEGGFRLGTSLAPALQNETPSATNPTICPDRSDVSTGIGGATNEIDLICQGTSLINLTSTTIGFYGASGATQATGYTTFTNLSTDRTCDANSTTVEELADILGTLIEDLKGTGLISA